MNQSARITRAADWVSTHLDSELSLRKLAEIANLSEYHFHRRFLEVTGETPHAFVVRQRLERAALLLRYAPRMLLTDVGLLCGFGSSSSFSRSVRQAFGMSPKQLRSRLSGNGLMGPTGPRHPVFNHSTCQVRGPLDVSAQRVAVEEWPAMDLAYVRLTGIHPTPTALSAPLTLLRRWARRNELDPATSRCIGIHLDTPEITSLSRSRYAVGIETSKKPSPEDGFGWTQIPPSLWAVCRIQGDPSTTDHAWRYLFEEWLPGSQYLPSALPPLEVSEDVPEFIQCTGVPLACCLPITPS